MIVLWCLLATGANFAPVARYFYEPLRLKEFIIERMHTRNDNSLTLQGYQDKTQEYVNGTPPIDNAIRSWLNASLELVLKDGKI